MPVASFVHDNFLAGVGRGEGDSDWSALARLAAVTQVSERTAFDCPEGLTGNGMSSLFDGRGWGRFVLVAPDLQAKVG